MAQGRETTTVTAQRRRDQNHNKDQWGDQSDKLRGTAGKGEPLLAQARGNDRRKSNAYRVAPALPKAQAEKLVACARM